MKRFFYILFFLSLPILAQDDSREPLKEAIISETLNLKEVHGVEKNLMQNYQLDYARGSFIGVEGRGYTKGGFHLSPEIKADTDLYRWGMIGLGVRVDYRDFFFSVGYKYYMPFQEFKAENMGNVGTFTFGFNFFGLEIYNEFEGGTLPAIRNVLNYEKIYLFTAELGISDYIGIKWIAYDDRFNRIELDGKAGVRLYLAVEEYFYDLRLGFKYKNRHPWGELGFYLFGIRYDSFGTKSYYDMTLESGFSFWDNVLFAPFSFNSKDPLKGYYNTILALIFEYRFYFLYPFEGALANFYLAPTLGFGFGYRHYESPWINPSKQFHLNGIYWYGASLGYNFYDALTFQAGVIVNNKKEILILLGMDILSFSF